MTSTTAAESQSDFSMVLGGPLYQLFLRLHILRAPLDLLVRRIVIISLFAWLPLLVLSICVGRAWGGVKVPFLYDIDAHVRFLVALPLLILAEWVVHIRFRPIIGQFLERNIITPADRPRYDEIIWSSFRLRNSIVAEVILILFVIFVGPILWRHQSALEASTWYADVGPGGMHLTLAGIYFRYVALPMFQFMLLRWYFRLFIWCRFLWKVSRLNLNLLPTHPDAAGGLGFLAGSAHAMLPFLIAQSALLAGNIANHIFYEGAKLVNFKMEILGIVIFLLLLALGPLVVFVRALSICQRTGNRQYGVLASRYVAEFHQKWIAGSAAKSDELLGSADIQSLADLANSFSVIRTMGLVPFSKTTVIRIAVVTLIPLSPLALTVIPFDQLVDHLLKALL